jgi:hypothetical protein
MEHTPGAIRAAEILGFGSYTDSKHRVPTANGDKTIKGIADLIDMETAAPDLLEACKEAERVIRWAAQESQGRVKATIVGGWVHHADKLHAAIAKATPCPTQPKTT